MDVERFDYTKTTFALITGASQGIGQTIAIELCKRLTKGTIVLVARSQDGLETTKQLIDALSKDIQVFIFPMDLSKPLFADYLLIFDQFKDDYDNALIVHNAGSLGTLDKAINYTNAEEWSQFLNLNVISASLLNSAFVAQMRAHSKRLFVVNIGSLCGIQPFKNMGMYGTGKAARNLFFKVLAVEEPDTIVLNYNPGPVETDMYKFVCENAKDAEIKACFNDSLNNKTVLTTDVTTNKLLDVLDKGGYKSGATIDYYDV